jgi:hypothetical protein
MFLFHSHVQDILAKRQAASSPAQCIAAGAHFKSLFHSLSTPPNTAPYPSGSCSLASDAHWSGWTSRRARSPRASLPWTDALCATMMPRNKRTALRCVSKKKKKKFKFNGSLLISVCVFDLNDPDFIIVWVVGSIPRPLQSVFFQVAHQTRRTFFLYATDAVSRDEWAQAILVRSKFHSLSISVHLHRYLYHCCCGRA